MGHYDIQLAYRGQKSSHYCDLGAATAFRTATPGSSENSNCR